MAASKHPIESADERTPPDGPEPWKIRAIEATNTSLELRSELAANRVERAEIKQWMVRIHGELAAMRTARRAWTAALVVAIVAAFLVGFAAARVHP